MNLKYVNAKFSESKLEINNWIKATYNKADAVLTAADPYGHILQAVEMVFHTTMLYLKNVLAQFDLNNPQNRNAKMINLWARIAGYNPSRGISATGTLALQLKPGINVLEEISGGTVTIKNFSALVNKTNGYNYFIDLGGAESISYSLEAGKFYYLPVVQGSVEMQPSTGDGYANQRVAVNVAGNQKIENFRVSVFVNGEYYAVKDHLYDMLEDEPACMVRTGIGGGIDVYFGTGNYGRIPALGALIQIRYVLCDGSLGNLPHHLPNDWTFTDEVLDGSGIPVEIEQNFNVFIEHEINMGSDGESVDFTRAALPFASRNFVLARPEQYKFHLQRLQLFSTVDAFTLTRNLNGTAIEDAIVYLFLVPNINLLLGGGSSYFDLDLSAFILNNYDKQKIERYLKMQGILSTGTAMRILDPKISRYVLNMYVELYDDVDEGNVKSAILKELSTYFIGMNRRLRIAKSDITRIVGTVDGVVSVGVDFVSENNENYHRAFQMYRTSMLKANPLLNPESIRLEGYEPNRVVGLDPNLNDILYALDEMPLIRGGWSDRYGVAYGEFPTGRGLGSVNIVVDSTREKRSNT